MPSSDTLRRSSDRPAVPDRPQAPTPAEAAHLADVLSHRLRGLVSGIVGFTDLLLEQLSSNGQRELAMRIMESAQRIEHVLADLKHFTRPVTPEPEDIPISVLLGELVRRLPDEMAERLKLDLEAARGHQIRADRYLARDIVLHLVQNAAEASKAPASIGLTVTPAGTKVRIDISNEGSIDPDVLPFLFEPFYTSKARNLGVGLPLSRRLARLQGGDVTLVDGGPPGFVIFRLEIPAAAA